MPTSNKSIESNENNEKKINNSNNNGNNDINEICIVLATYKPNLDFFKQQITSIIQQTFTNWICIVTDDMSPEPIWNEIQKICVDPRFIFLKSQTQLGSYKNFEKGLSEAPRNIPYIALCDQDDVWHNQKLEKMLDAIKKSKTDQPIMLVHSDLRLIDSNNKILDLSCWRKEQRNIELDKFKNLSHIKKDIADNNDRINDTSDTSDANVASDSNNYQIFNAAEINSYIFRNTVTGCSTLFDRKILDFALPFPDLTRYKRSIPFHHDQWLALSALQFGAIYPLVEPLIDYRQHANNVVGAQSASIYKDFAKLFDFAKLIRTFYLMYNERIILKNELQTQFKLKLTDNQSNYDNLNTKNELKKWDSFIGLLQINSKFIHNYKDFRLLIALIIGQMISIFR